MLGDCIDMYTHGQFKSFGLCVHIYTLVMEIMGYTMKHASSFTEYIMYPFSSYTLFDKCK